MAGNRAGRVLPQAELFRKAKKIQYLLLDVDGVMTDGSLFFDESGRELKRFSSYDGHGVRLLQKANIGVGIISGRNSFVVTWRAKELGIEDVYQGMNDKLGAYEKILEKRALEESAVAYMGDDLIDLPVLRRVGFAISVPNAVDAVKKEVDWVTKRRGGDGAAREAIDLILAAQVEGKPATKKSKRVISINDR